MMILNDCLQGIKVVNSRSFKIIRNHSGLVQLTEIIRGQSKPVTVIRGQENKVVHYRSVRVIRSHSRSLKVIHAHSRSVAGF